MEMTVTKIVTWIPNVRMKVLMKYHTIKLSLRISPIWDWILFVWLVLREFKEQLHKQATVEAFIEWLDIIVEQKVIKVLLVRTLF